jgi:hypothetical protein
MTPPVVGLGTLRRLSQMPVDGTQVLSVYVDFDPASPSACRCQFEAMAATSLQSRHCEAARRRVDAMLRGTSTLAHGTRGLAMFSVADGSTAAMVPLPARVEEMAVLERVPWLEPLTSMLTSGAWGAAIVQGDAARLLRGGEAGLIEFAAVCSHADRGAASACSGSRSGRCTQRRLALQAHHTANLLTRAHRRRPFERLALAAPCALWSALQENLPADLRERLIGLLELDPLSAPACIGDELATLLKHMPDPWQARCENATATTTLAAGAASTVSQSTAKAVRPLAHRRVGLRSHRAPLGHTVGQAQRE